MRYMVNAKERLKRVGLFVRKNSFIFFVIGVYIFFSAYYMGPGFTNCSDSIYGFGDSTGGPIWRNSLKPDQPTFGGPQNTSNYPYGESLYSPVIYAATVQTVAMDVATKFVGPVCAYNLYNITGYVLTGLVMYLFITYLTRNKWVALIAGYAVAFTPYVQGKVGGHPNYGYAALLIGVLWLLIHWIQTRKVWAAAAFGGLLALSAYLDLYFVLLAATIVAPAFGAWMLLGWWKNRKKMTVAHIVATLRPLSKPALAAGVVFLVGIAPIAFVRISNAEMINTTVGKMRGDVTAAAMQCSNTPLDYLIPDPTNIHLINIFGRDYTAKNISMRHWCGYGESRVSVSLTLVLVLALGVGIFLYRRHRGLKNPVMIYGYNPTLVGLVLGMMALLAILVGMPPKYGGMTTLSGFVLEVTAMWRIFAREFLVVNIALVVSASILLAYLMKSTAVYKHGSKRILVWALPILVFIGIVFEYQINTPFEPMTFSYSRDTPNVYKTIRDDPAIHAIAEYPIDRIGLEYDSAVYYVTMQTTHGKKLFNSALAGDSKENEHISLKDLADPQTIPALRYIGIDSIVVHGESTADVAAILGDNIRVVQSDRPTVYSLQMLRPDDNPTIALLRVNEGRAVSNIIAITKGYAVNLPNIQSPIGSEYELLNDAELSILPLLLKSVTSAPMCFDIKMAAAGDSGHLSLTRDKEVIQTLPITDQYSRIMFVGNTGDTIRLVNDKGYNMRINNLDAGCGVAL